VQAISLGFVRVPTPGTPVQLCYDDQLLVMQMIVRTVPGLTGRTYLGIAGMNKSAQGMPGVVRVFSEPPAFGPQDGETLPPAASDRGNVIRVSDFWLDADVAGEGVVVMCLVA
jgi:hypothetical protein